jgi:hypothetical protein
MTMEQQLAVLTARVEALEVANEGLRVQLEAARGGLDLTMRGQGRCRACGGSKILHATTVADVGTTAMAVAVSPFWATPQGTFETYICVGCGHVEWYVKDPTEVKVDGKVTQWHVVDAAPGPYR